MPAHYNTIPLTDRIFEELGFKIEKRADHTNFFIEYPNEGHFSINDTLGYRWTGDCLKGAGFNMTTVGDLREKHFSLFSKELDITGIKTSMRESIYVD